MVDSLSERGLTMDEIIEIREILSENKVREQEKESIIFEKVFELALKYTKAKQIGPLAVKFGSKKDNFIWTFINDYGIKLPIIAEKTIKDLKKVAEIIYKNHWEGLF